MTPVDIIALIFAGLIIVKAIFVLFAHNMAKRMADWFLSKQSGLKWMGFISLLAFFGLLYVLLQEMSIMEVIGGMFLMALVYGFLFYTAFRELLKRMADKMSERNIYIVFVYLVFLGLAGYVIYTIFWL